MEFAQQDFDPAHAMSLPAGMRQQFFCDRFAALNEVEQALILARLLVRQNKQDLSTDTFSGTSTSQMDKAVEIFRAGDAKWRMTRFEAILTGRSCSLDTVTNLFLETHKNYFPALLVALEAAYDGHDLGLLTARGNRRGHDALIEAIHGFVGVTIPRRNIYFVNDETRNQRLGQVSTADKKLQILRNFVDGEYLDENGQLKAMSQKYDRVLFYDDEAKNLNTVSAYSVANRMEGRLIAVDAKRLSVSEIWGRLITKVDAGLKIRNAAEKAIHFFDIDGTLIKLDARMYVIHRDTKQRLLTVTQEQLAAHGVPYWLAKAHQENPGFPVEILDMDFADFVDPQRVRGQVEQGRQNNVMFKKDRG